MQEKLKKMAVRKCDLFKQAKFVMIDEHPCVLKMKCVVDDGQLVPHGNIAFYVGGTDIFTGLDHKATVRSRETTEPVVLIDTYKILKIDKDLCVLQHANGHIRSDLQISKREHHKKIDSFGSGSLVQVARWGAKECIWNIARDKTQPVEQSSAAIADAELSLHARKIINNKRCQEVKDEISSNPRNRFYRRYIYGGCPVFCEAVLDSVYFDLVKHKNPIAENPKLRRKLFRFARAWYYRALLPEPF